MSVHEAPAPNPRKRERRVTSRKDADWWVTPAWATEALLESERLPRCVWDPCCGDGAMVRPIMAAGHIVMASDLHYRGYGTGETDFLLSPMASGCTGIVMNPPFNLATRFIAHALALAPEFLAVFGPIGLLAGQERGIQIYDRQPPSRVWVFSRRVTLLHGSLAAQGMTEAPSDMRGATNFAWLVWNRRHRGTQIGWIP
jgi:hypothetical protein